MKNTKNRQRLRYISYACVIASLYTALTLIVGPFGNAIIQCRIAEALCVLPFFTSAAIPGLTLGCLISNLVTGCIWQDILFGTLATLVGALGARALRRFPPLVPLPTVLANTFIIPIVLTHSYGAKEGIWFLMLTVGIGEIISAYILGLILLYTLKKHDGRIFR